MLRADDGAYLEQPLQQKAPSLLDASRVRRDAPYRAAIQEVVDAVQRLHALPAQWHTVPLIPTRVREHGAYTYGRSSGIAYGIEFDERGSHHAATILHEVGHLLDHQFIGTPGVWASYPVADASLIEWSQAVRSTAYWRQMDQLLRNPATASVYGELDALDVRRLSYLLDERELFARSYMQWAAMRGNVSSVLAELPRLRPSPAEWNDFPEQWDDSDFERAALALDELFLTLHREPDE